ncbi:Zinc finger CCCH domain-containing protein [Zostera marina]|uniref:Zinc finger CCCH domain-containing protein n=1 Tax=Zostera marina TaxID=29655 RepID=A0A0K9Q4D8_ZOSMR|nr:Zinc finger CCCH domain-containing protein [Zostera marina]
MFVVVSVMSNSDEADNVCGGGEKPEHTDEFRMYAFKIKRCSKNRSHDWTECPYAHRGEKARRRDPRKHPYVGVACAEFRHAGDCSKGQHCEFAHGVFEFWLHPSRYRTRTCKAGSNCTRKVCFFAHTAEELREEKQMEWFFEYWGATAAAMVVRRERSDVAEDDDDDDNVFKDILNDVRRLSVAGAELSDLPDIRWICELIS